MLCKNCGTSIDNGALYCPICGQNQSNNSVKSESFYLYNFPFLLSGENLDILQKHQENRALGSTYGKEFIRAFSRCTTAKEAMITSFNLMMRYYSAMASRIVKKNVKNGIYAITESDVINALMPTLQMPIFLNAMNERIVEFAHEKDSDHYQREQRKHSRGKLVGGGFGLLGAMQGILVANAVNAFSGMAYSAKNIIGDYFSDVKYNKQANKILSPKVSYKLSEIFIDDCVTFCDYEQPNNVYSFVKRMEAISIFEKLQSGDIESNNRERAFVSMLKIYPAYPCFYEWAERHLDDSFGELQRLKAFLEIQ